jgi:hypothetical protein
MRFATIPRQNSSLDAELLVRFALRRLSEIESDQTEPPQVVMALALAAAFHEKEFHDRLKEDVTSSSLRADEILRLSKALFVPLLFGQTVDRSDRADENPFPDEESCKIVLHYALGEGKRMLYEKDFEFLRVFEFLTRTGLFCYSYRLWQFESSCRIFQDDQTSLVQEELKIIEDALGIPGNRN